MAVNGPAVRAVGQVLRRVSRALDAVGLALQTPHGHVEKLVPSTRVVAVGGKKFEYGNQAFVASSASVVGEVKFGEATSLWYGATIKADKHAVTVGRNTAILDNAVVSARAGPCKLGDDVVVSPGAVVQSAEIGDGTMVGMGAMIMPGARIGNDCFIDGGCVVPAGTVVGSGQLWTGNPGRFLRTLSAEEMSYMRTTALEYGKLSEQHQEQSLKGVEQLEEDAEIARYKEEHGLAHDAPLPQQDADVVQYYKLTAEVEDSGLFRDKEFDIAAEASRREAEEAAADAEETARYYELARVRRVVATLNQLAGTKPGSARAAQVLQDLAALDPEAAERARGFIGQAAAALSSNDAHTKHSLTEVLATFGPHALRMTDAAEASKAAEELLGQLAAHSGALGAGGAAGSRAGAGGAAGASL